MVSSVLENTEVCMPFPRHPADTSHPPRDGRVGSSGKVYTGEMNLRITGMKAGTGASGVRSLEGWGSDLSRGTQEPLGSQRGMGRGEGAG